MWKIATYILKGGLREQVAGLETQLQRAVEDFREMQGRGGFRVLVCGYLGAREDDLWRERGGAVEVPRGFADEG